MLSDDITDTARTGVHKTRSVLGGIVKGALIGAGVALLVGAAIVAAPGIAAGVGAIAAGHGLLAGAGMMLCGIWGGLAAAASGVGALFMGGAGSAAATAPAAIGTGAAIGAAVLGTASLIPGVRDMLRRHDQKKRMREMQENVRTQAQAQSMDPVQVDIPSRPIVVRQAQPSVVVNPTSPDVVVGDGAPQQQVVITRDSAPPPQVVVHNTQSNSQGNTTVAQATSGTQPPETDTPNNPEFRPGRGIQMMQKGDAAQSAIAKA